MAAEEFPESKADLRAVETIGHQARNRLFIAIALIVVAVLALIWITRGDPPAKPTTAPSAAGIAAQAPTESLLPSEPSSTSSSEMAASSDIPPPPSASVPVMPRQTGPSASAQGEESATSPSAESRPTNVAPPLAAADKPAPASATPQPKVEPQPEPAKPGAPMVRNSPAKVGATGYVLQLGVFTNYQNAKQLQERLAQAGIQSYTETRVHVGPFTDKTEADQAREKMKALGISGVIVPAH